MTEQWQELKETIIEMRDNDGTGTQQETCKFLANLMDVLEKQMEEPIDKSAMMYEIYMEGVNMTGEYQGCWVRFKNIEKIVDKYMAESEK